MRRLRCHWLLVTNAIVGCLLGLTVLAPMMRLVGLDGPAGLLYRAYSPICHQMAQRSFFVAGEQWVYPRATAGLSATPIEAYIAGIPAFAGVSVSDWGAFSRAAGGFVGNQRLGYKLALCQRMSAIFLAVFAGGLIFAGLRRSRAVEPLGVLPLVAVAMLPIALDGSTQLLGHWSPLFAAYLGPETAAWVAGVFPERESTPALRVLTGGLFGFGVVWRLYPVLQARLTSEGARP